MMNYSQFGTFLSWYLSIFYLRTSLTCENNALVSFFSGLGEFQTEALSICVEKQVFPVGNQMERYLSMDTMPNKIRGLFVL